MRKLNGRKRRLSCYGSGDGSLSLTWIDRKGHASSVGISRHIARRYLKGNVDAKNLLEKGYKVWTHGSIPVLVADVSRVDERTLQVGGHSYSYAIKDVEDDSWKVNHEVMDYNLDLTDSLSFNNGILVLTAQVMSISTRSQVRYFLTHEEEMKENPPESV